MARHLQILDFTYDLPENRIALHPLAERDASKLLVYRNGLVSDDYFRNLPIHLPENTLLALNDTKVVEARLLFQTREGEPIELFFLEPATAIDQTSAMRHASPLTVRCFIGKAKKWKSGEVLLRDLPDDHLYLEARLLEKTGDHFIVQLDWSPADTPFATVLHSAGQIPLPPYIRRRVEDADAERYQTVYARQQGSVAAPTAGLHFTDAVFQKILEKGVETERVTLHVGAGTFKPVHAETMAGHAMHGEYIDVDVSLIRKLAAAERQKTIVAVGTTSMRTLESLYWLGMRVLRNNPAPDVVPQFEPYDAPADAPASEALGALADALAAKGRSRLLAQTHLMIAPGYHFRLVDGLVTNFHQPQSTLLLLVAAFIGPDWKKVYGHALAYDYRFLSYGDGSLLWKAG